ncbi:hypothetical protein OIU74_005193 [Salix koriyanagi]|uniref:Uncharacterized protein n=1 Tax=Salix koriyanagi TaxID=2511006 RepID=A0A9Q0UP07_9ROSI|nr:hypothetical protein OIU74_005193 [Salix koriyanagi]
MDVVFVLMLFSEPDRQAVKKVVTEVELRALEDILAHVASQTTKEEQEYIAEENIQNQVQKDHIDLQRKFSLMEIMLRSWVVFFSQMRNYFRWSCHVTLFNLKRTCLYNCYNGCRSKVMEIDSPKVYSSKPELLYQNGDSTSAWKYSIRDYNSADDHNIGLTDFSLEHYELPCMT